MAEAGKEVYSLPISAKSEVPLITLDTPCLDYGHCFIHYPYTLDVIFNNSSCLPVKYEMEPPSNRKKIHFFTKCPNGVIKPQTTFHLPLQIETQILGEIIAVVLFKILGSQEEPLEVVVRCIGEGPVISASLTEVHWGIQPVLQPLPKIVKLNNESLIPAEFECILVC